MWTLPVFKEFTDRNGNPVRLLSAGRGSTLALTNFVANERLVLKAGCSVTHITLNPDGTQTWAVTGHNLLVLFPTDVPAGPSTTLHVGQVVFTVDPAEVFTVQSVTGTSTDICAALE
jgi:hypothetical protein